jgi:hypothetical protein
MPAKEKPPISKSGLNRRNRGYAMKTQLKIALIAAAVFSTMPTLAAAQATFEVNIDRPGEDYSNFDLPRARPRLCQQSCFEDGSCRAWTYVRPGFQGPAPRCWLKSGVPAGTPSDCCVSGVVRN